MSSLSHPNITKIYSWYITPDRKEGGIYMEYCDQGNLEDWLNVAKQTYEQDGTQIDAEFVLHVMEGLTSAVAYLHSGLDGGKCVIHRDIKPANIFLS
ncbi:kinase-like protein, partial [Amniculicola lignicola CBS 123094]